MELTEWQKNYHRDHMGEYLREAIQEYGMPGEIRKEKAFMGNKEVDRYWYEDADGVLMEGICFEDIEKICKNSEADVEPEVLARLVCEGWEEHYRFVEENREMLFEKDTAQYLFPVLMNTKLNEGLLKKMPHVEKGELSITLHLAMPTEGLNGNDLLVSNQMLEAWGIGLDEALSMAVRNPWFFEQCKAVSNVEMLRMENQQIEKEWCGMFQIVEPENEEVTGYTICGRHVPCAAILLNPEFTQSMHEKMGGDFLVGFSSTGEVEICKNQQDIEDMQIELEVHTELWGFSWEYISDQVYQYSKERGLALAVASDSRKAEIVKPAEHVPRR